MSRNPENPQTRARTAGVIYVLIIAIAIFAESVVRGGLIVSGDPVATAAHIRASETLFRFGLAGEVLTCAGDTCLALILYMLLRPVGRNLALLGAFHRLVFVAIYGVAKLFEVAALNALDGAPWLGALAPGQAEALAYLFLRVHAMGYGISLLFFGACCLAWGWLIARSGFLPRLIGQALFLGGVGYVVFSTAQMLAPKFAGDWLFPWLLLPAFFGELGLAVWLLVKGVDAAKWRQASEA